MSVVENTVDAVIVGVITEFEIRVIRLGHIILHVVDTCHRWHNRHMTIYVRLTTAIHIWLTRAVSIRLTEYISRRHDVRVDKGLGGNSW